MQLKEETKRGIERTTGVAFSALLERKPKPDPRLRLLKGNLVPLVEDPLVRGEPSLAMGHITTIEEVDAYFDAKPAH